MKIASAITRVFVLALTAISFATTASAATFTVTNTNDSGAGSLRQAIIDAAATGVVDTIVFNIPGGGVKKIAPLTEFPDVGPNTIDGTTQPGWSVGNLMIEISGENLTGSTATGLKFISIPDSLPQVFVRGLAINRFVGTGVYVQDSQNVTIEGCHIGTDASGSFALGNRVGINIRAANTILDTKLISIGGNTSASRNVISGNSFLGIDIFGGSEHFIRGNFIGTDKGGNFAIPNGTGIQMTSFESTIGGTTVSERNVISGNRARGIVLNTSIVTVQNNYIGVGADGLTPLGNGGTALDVISARTFDELTSQTISTNLIANNAGDGIRLGASNLIPRNVRITNNSIFNNFRNFVGDRLGIALDDDGATPNDEGDADTGPNNLQNKPILTSASSTLTNTNIQGTFNSAPSTSYRIEYYLNDSAQNEGKTQMFVQNITTDTSGDATINTTVPFPSRFGQYVTATATRNVTPFDTSEFSVPVPVSVTTFVVTNANNSGVGSLRQAITDANASSDANLITFAITPLDGTVKTINLTSPLPTITSPLAIDGLTQNGADCSSPKIELNGSGAGAGGDGFTVAANGSLIQGIVINRFLGDGLILDSLTNTVRCNRIGTSADGNTDLGNGLRGIFLDVSHFNRISENTISGNGQTGILGSISQYNEIFANVIGLSANGTAVVGNSQGGIVLVGGFSNVIGGTTAARRNVVSGNGLAGIGLTSSTFSNIIKGNYIGVDSSGGGVTLGNTGPGILLATSATDNFIGGTEQGSENIIAFNSTIGISLLSTSGDGNRILRNAIYNNVGMALDINADGVTANDSDDPDAGPNGQQNFPVLTGAEAFFGGLKVIGSINSTPNTDLRLEFYSNAACDGTNGEGRTFLGSLDVRTDSSGDYSFIETVTGIGVSVGEVITATATRRAAPYDTSEFSACRTATALTGITDFTVTNTNDSGVGSFRQAIMDANSNQDLSQIKFNISGGGVKTITPTTAFPVISAPVLIDGLSQTGSNCADPLIELNGTSTSGVDGLNVTGAADVRGVIINRFDGDGIEFSIKGNNSVRCSRIGVSADGLTPQRNGHNGLYFNRVSNNKVGGANGDGNVISSNGANNPPGFNFDGGIHFFLSTDNVVQGNIIGLDKDGLITTTFLNNRQENGIVMLNVDRTLIGGKTAAERNIISGNDTAGIYMQNSDENVFTGNYIGLDINGTTSGSTTSLNGRGIDKTNSNGNRIGGVESGEGNVISANGFGIRASGSLELVIQGNVIGLAPSGMSTVGIPQSDGISIQFQSTATIGGRTPAERNIVGGNSTGITVTNNNSTSGTATAIIEGNYIGIGANGTTVFSNSTAGILLAGLANGSRIGGGATGAGNVISGGGSKIRLDSSNNLVQGNLIGTDATGTIDVSTGNGIDLLAGGTNNTIGGPTAGMRNVIGGGTFGIRTASGVTSANGNTIQNNLIGTAVDGVSALPNNQSGIVLESSNNKILNNTIANSAIKGIVILSAASGNTIRSNSIYANGTTAAHLGIDLGDDGVTANDTGDGDLANNHQNYPILTAASASGITGTLNSAANATFTLEFYSNPTVEASGFGEGKTFLGSLNVTTNGSGNASFTFISPVGVFGGEHVVATATSVSGDTSEFSQSRPFLGPTSANVEVAGQVVSNTGLPIGRTYLTLSDQSGNVHQALTNPFGYFRFSDIPSGQTYVLSMRSKSFVFTPSSISIAITSDINDLLIIGSRREELTAPEPSSIKAAGPADPDPNTLNKRRP